jgi:hypothetical protein
VSRNAAAWRAIAAGFPSFNITLEQMQAWDLMLSDQSPEALLLGAVAYGRESKYPTPTIAGWLEHARNADPDRAERLTAAEAWDEMYRNRHGRYARKVTWSSEAVHRAARAVRWDDPNWESEQIPTIRAQFERYYNSLADKTERIDEVNAVRAIADHSERMKQLYGPGFAEDAE